MTWERDALGALGGRSSVASLDQAAAYLRAFPERVVPLYLLAMAPFSLVMVYLVDAATAADYAAIPVGAGALVPATLWRWFFLAVLQRRIQEDLRGQPPLPLRSRLGAILYFRLLANLCQTWGGMIIVPAYYGFLTSSLVGPMLLERAGPAGARIKEGFTLVNSAGTRLHRVALSISLLFVWMIVVVVALHLALLFTVIPAFLGLDTNELAFTFSGAAWIIGMVYGLMVLLDFFWTVAGVFVFYDLLSRRLGTDLLRRTQALAAALPEGERELTPSVVSPAASAAVSPQRPVPAKQAAPGAGGAA